MLKKTLISLAVASSVALTGCLQGASTGNADPQPTIIDTTQDASIVTPVFNPNPLSPSVAFPANYDLLLLLGASQSKYYDFTGYNTGTDPASQAINGLAGFSTSGQTDIKFSGSLNPSTVLKGKTVFLFPLNMKAASTSLPDAIPNVDPTNINSTSPVDTTKLASLDYRVSVISLDGGSNNVIRITPLKPLPSATKFLVVITNGVTGADGKPTQPSKEYNWFKGNEPLGPSNLDSIRTLIQSEDALAAGILKANSVSNSVTLSYSFTTSSPGKVLKTLAAPGAYLNTLGEKMVLDSGLQVIRNYFDNHSVTYTANDVFALFNAIVNGPTDAYKQTTFYALYYNALKSAVLADVGTYSANSSLASTIVGTAIATAAAKDELPYPKSRTTYFIQSETKTASQMAAVAAAAASNTALAYAASHTMVYQGAIQLPYYLQLPGTDGSGLINGHWTGNTDIEKELNTQITAQQATYPGLSNFQFPRDAVPGSTTATAFNVTYNYPFPQRTAYVAAPVVVYYPDTTVCPSGINGVVIFQHGITVDRSVATFPAINFAVNTSNTCLATVAIDQPLHGLGGSTVGTISGLTPLVSDATLKTQFPNASYIGERHFMFTRDTSKPTTFSAAQETDITKVSSGSLFINLVNLQTARDNLRQGVMDLLNLSASINAMSLDNSSTHQLSGKPVFFVGHSLGGITGTVFSEISTDPTVQASYNSTTQGLGLGANPAFKNLQSVALMNTGGMLTKLVENSTVFSGQILQALAASNAAQGTSNFENFMYIMQSMIDGADPVNYGIDLGATIKSTNKPNLLMEEVVGDKVVPNQANVNPLGQALSAPLAGTEPLMALVDQGLGGGKLSDGTGLHLIETGPGTTAPAASFFLGDNPCTEARHGTFVSPATPASSTDTICPGGSNTANAFAEMMTETISGLTTGTVSSPNTNSVLTSSSTLKSALDQN